MSKWIKVDDEGEALINVDNISYVHVGSMVLGMNANHSGGNGILRLNKEDLQKVLDALEETS